MSEAGSQDSRCATSALTTSIRYLKPGGFIELVEIDWRMNSDDPAPRPCAFHDWYTAVSHAASAAGKPLVGITENLEPWLHQAGFSRRRWLTERLDIRENLQPDRQGLKNRLARLQGGSLL